MTVDTTPPLDLCLSEPTVPRQGPSLSSRVLVRSIHLYQMARAGRPTGCRYLPTCSAYAEEAILRFGPIRGLALATRRLVRCGPWGGHGVDPVPDRSSSCRR
jgi:putative membrane protein insertion efficiency factor